MSVSFWQIALVVVLAVLLFGRGRISDLMGDVAKGIKAFKKGIHDDDQDKAALQQSAEAPVDAAVKQDQKNSA